MKYFTKKFENVNALVTYLDSAQTQPNFGWCCESQSHDADFYGYDSYEQARERLVNGDQELCKLVKYTDKLDINATGVGIRKKVVTRVAGFAPHVPNFIAGIPNNMLWVEEHRLPSKVLTIIYNVGCSGDRDATEVAHTSARLFSAIMSLERKGYRLNLYVASAQEKSSQRTCMLVKIKEAGQHMDALKMCLPMISPAMNRRFGFRYRETMPGLKECWVGGYGRSLRGDDFRETLDDNHIKYDIAIASQDIRNVESVDELVSLFEKQVKDKKNKH